MIIRLCISFLSLCVDLVFQFHYFFFKTTLFVCQFQGLKGYRLYQIDTCRQINLYHIFSDDFSVNSQLIFMKFSKDFFRVTQRLP